MSQWTHICGCIRIDGIEFSRDIETKIRESFGNIFDYYSIEEDWDNCNVPYGSEGSVQYKIDRTGTEDTMSWGLVSIWGDLRDYDDYNEVYEWIKSAHRKLSDTNLSIRNCAVLVEVEFTKSYLIFNKYDKEKNETNIVMKEIE